MSIEASADGTPKTCDWDRSDSEMCDSWSSSAVASQWLCDVVAVGVRSGSAEAGRFFA